jgi:two-component system chemotaxis response regulator CheY
MSKTFLIVDDSASMRQLIAFTIKDAGYDVLLAENGKDALEKMSHAKVDMVITDLNMPEMDGITFIRELRGKADYKFVPIVMLTTESQEAKKQEGRAAGASGWIVKPFSPSQLMDVVKKFVKEERGQ